MKRQKKPVKNNGVMNIHHPKVANSIEFAFEAIGTKYYCFKQDSEGRYGRYVVMQAYLQEYYLRIDLETLKRNINQLKNWLNPPIIKDIQPRLELGKSLELLEIMEQRANIAFEPETVYRLSSCLYFDEFEDLSGYDGEYNKKKIAAWKEAGITDFFFHELFKGLTHLTVTSKTDLANYLQRVPGLLKGWSSIEDILSR